ncbi:L-proline trans-4-hydroxylase-like [Liolophura sinensis]|uniref:L-proline trans-4-hydroxylase-like n=1 Tax=Liolophura sinensis TaxID=3198878 RepID=UPI00315899DF
MDAIFQFDPKNPGLTQEMKDKYNEYGYFILRNVLDAEEMKKMKHVLENNEEIKKNTYGIADSEGTHTRVCIWSHPGNDVSGMVARSEKIAGYCEELLDGGEVYHYHTKFMMKNAKVGGRFEWHQDYGYWYKNGCLFPQIASVMMAVDRCDKENGCLQVLRGSHKCGRIDHNFVGGQTGADPVRVQEIAKKCPLDYVIMDPGDALYFDCNLLHKSNANPSDKRRWAIVFSYNLKSNDPVYKHHHPNYTPMTKVPNSAIIECTNLGEDMSGKDFLDPSTDKTVKADK